MPRKPIGPCPLINAVEAQPRSRELSTSHRYHWATTQEISSLSAYGLETSTVLGTRYTDRCGWNGAIFRGAPAGPRSPGVACHACAAVRHVCLHKVVRSLRCKEASAFRTSARSRARAQSHTHKQAGTLTCKHARLFLQVSLGSSSSLRMTKQSAGESIKRSRRTSSTTASQASVARAKSAVVLHRASLLGVHCRC